MSLVAINRNPSSRELRQFGCLWLPAFLALVAWTVVRRWAAWDLGTALLMAAGLSVAAGLWRPAVLRPVFVGWLIAVHPIGWIVSHALLAVLYYLVMTPIGIVMRLAGHDPMDRAIDPAATTFWVRRTGRGAPARYFRQF